MRLIDADALDRSLADAQAKCKKSGGNFRFGVLSNVRANIADAPTIDAIPVEWLIKLEKDMKDKDRALSVAAWLVLHEWQKEQKEQEARST